MFPMPSEPSRTYRVGEFARLAGVTPRALHHYDRLGLLKPHRSSAGYRVYADADLERLVQIVALKFVGIPLKKISRLLTTGSDRLAAALHAQRQVLEERRQLLDQAIAAVREAERALRVDGQAAPGLYRRIIEVIEMQDSNDWDKKYQGLVDTKIERLKALTADDRGALRQEWSALVEDVRAVLADDPASPRAQALANRWLEMLGRLMGGPIDRNMIRGAAAAKPGSQWGPSEADRPVWEFMQRALEL